MPLPCCSFDGDRGPNPVHVGKSPPLMRAYRFDAPNFLVVASSSLILVSHHAI
jgi:hypothetical protein